MFLSLPLSIWLTLNCEAFAQAVFLMTFLLTQEGLGVSAPSHCSYNFYLVCIDHIIP